MLKKKIAQPVLVTGATGFIGSRVIHKLLQQNISLKALLLPGELYPAAWIDHMEIIRGSIVDPNSCKKGRRKNKDHYSFGRCGFGLGR